MAKINIKSLKKSEELGCYVTDIMNYGRQRDKLQLIC